jgi:hypothetical protein
VVQVKPELGTDPFELAGLNVQLTASTSVSQRPKSPLAAVWSWNSLIVAEVKDTSVMTSVQFGFGQPGAPGTGLTGAAVVVEMVTFPFLMSPAGTGVAPTSVTGAGFCPGAWFPPWFVHVEVVPPVAVRTCRVSKFPRPA